MAPAVSGPKGFHCGREGWNEVQRVSVCKAGSEECGDSYQDIFPDSYHNGSES